MVKFFNFMLYLISQVPKYRNAEKLYLMQKWNNCDLASDLISLKSNIEVHVNCLQYK